MVEWTDLPEGVLEDMKRYISYAWPPGRIAQLLNRSYGLDLTREAVIHMLRRLKQESVYSGPSSPPAGMSDTENRYGLHCSFE